MTASSSRNGRGLKPLLLAVALSAGLHTGATLAQTAAPAPQTIDIPAGSLAQALDRLGEQTGVLITYEPGLVQGLNAPRISGQLSVGEALRRLLSGSGIQVEAVNDKTFVLRRAPVTSQALSAGQAQQSASRREAQEEPATQNLEKITVTGTRIRGGSTPSPVITIGAERIREEGFTDLGEVIRSIPQNFSGGQNPGVASAEFIGAGYANANVTGGSSLNLRGLGPDATLTLLNGRRMSYGSYVQAVDISAIPVEAVERVEVVADGASAIYGSDAVGGVGNVILKRDFDGVALGARYGRATDGGLTTRQYTATAGTTWLSGGIIATYKDVSVDPIHVEERSYTSQMVEPATIYPGSDLRSGLISAHQSLGNVAELRLDALRTEREQAHYYSLPSGLFVHVTPETTTTLVSPGFDFWLPNDWQLSVGGTKGKDEHLQRISVQRPTLPSPTPLVAIEFCYCNESRTYEVGAEGPLFTLRGGDARLAVGVGYRKNEFRQPNYILGIIQVEGEEVAKSAYTEISIPLIGSESHAAFAKRLVVTAAARREDYDSFGGVTTPKLGLIYDPTSDVTLKASWGKSFKAPTLLNRYFPVVAGLQFPAGYGGAGYPDDATVLVLAGGNPDLDPERARTWSASLSFHPEALPGLESELTWFDIDYTDRVVQPITNISQALLNPIYAEFIQYSPTPGQQSEALAAAGSFVNSTDAPYDPNNVVALIYTRYVNATRQRTRGIDLSGAYRFDLGGGQMTIRGSTSWLDSSQQTAGAPQPYDLAGTLFNPAKINSRIGVVWSEGGLTGSAFANYKSGVRDTVRDTRTGSFTTIDATLRYLAGERNGVLSGVEIVLSAQNLLDRSPPFYDPTLPLYAAPYDSTNYSAIGRFLSLSVSKRW